jgi:hypothetical protein
MHAGRIQKQFYVLLTTIKNRLLNARKHFESEFVVKSWSIGWDAKKTRYLLKKRISNNYEHL